MSKRTVIKNGSLYMIGNLFNRAISFITVPIFTRMLTTQEYGIVNTYTAWVPLLAVVVGLSLGNSVRNAFVDFENELSEYVSSIFVLGTINFAIICIALAAITYKIDVPKSMVWFCIIESFFNYVINAVIMQCMMEEKAEKQMTLLILPNLTGAVLSVLFIMMMRENRHYGRIFATFVSTSCFGMIILAYYLIKYRSKDNTRYWKYALPISIPLIFHGLSGNVLGTSDRTIITYYCGSAETGIYSLVYNLGMVANVVTAAAEAVWIPRMTRSLQKKDYKGLNGEVKIYIYFVLFFLCGLLTIAPEMLWFLGGKEYMGGVNIVFPIVASFFIMFIYGIYASIEFYYKKSKMIAIATVIAASINLILNIIFIPRYGAAAAAYTTLFSYFISFTLHSIDAHRLDRNAVPYKILLFPIIIIILAGIITTLLNGNPILRISIMSSLGAIYAYQFLARTMRKKGGISNDEKTEARDKKE